MRSLRRNYTGQFLICTNKILIWTSRPEPSVDSSVYYYQCSERTVPSQRRYAEDDCYKSNIKNIAGIQAARVSPGSRNLVPIKRKGQSTRCSILMERNTSGGLPWETREKKTGRGSELLWTPIRLRKIENKIARPPSWRERLLNAEILIIGFNINWIPFDIALRRRWRESPHRISLIETGMK